MYVKTHHHQPRDVRVYNEQMQRAFVRGGSFLMENITERCTGAGKAQPRHCASSCLRKDPKMLATQSYQSQLATMTGGEYWVWH